jgi:hypothetical protein
MLFAMPKFDEHEIDMILLYAMILLACVVGVCFELWKVNQFGRWEPLRLMAAALGCVVAGIFLLVKVRKPRS